MTSVYLSQTNPRVPLRTEAELLAAVDGGLLRESHFLDLKREVKDGKSENRGIARDLAAFAVDGGTVIIGLGEGKDAAIECVPQPLSGLAERLDQVAAMIVDPPLSIGTAPGSVDSLPVRIAPRWKDQHHAEGLSSGVPS